MQVAKMNEVFPDRNPDDSPDQMTLGAYLDDDISRQPTLVLSPGATDGVNVGFLVVNHTNPFTYIKWWCHHASSFPTASACHVAPGNDWYRRWWIRGRVRGLQNPGQCVAQGVMCLNKTNL